jgi:hypothetical protein
MIALRIGLALAKKEETLWKNFSVPRRDVRVAFVEATSSRVERFAAVYPPKASSQVRELHGDEPAARLVP